MRLRHSLLAVLLASGAPVASGQTPEGAAEPMDITPGTAPMLKMREKRFDFLDVDGDGAISRDEIGEDDAILRSQFTSLDADGDGQLSETEYVESYRERIH